MISQAIFNTALRFAIGYTVLQALLLLLSRVLNLDPYGNLRMWPIYLLPLFIILSLRYLKQFEIGKHLTYGSAFRTGSLVTFFGSACSAMLLYVYGMLAGPQVLTRHQTEMRAMLQQTQKELSEAIGPQNLQLALEQIEQITPGSIAYGDFFLKLVLGTLASLIIAFFFRSRGPRPEPDTAY